MACFWAVDPLKCVIQLQLKSFSSKSSHSQHHLPKSGTFLIAEEQMTLNPPLSNHLTEPCNLSNIHVNTHHAVCFCTDIMQEVCLNTVNTSHSEKCTCHN